MQPAPRRAPTRFLVMLVVAALLSPCLTYGGFYGWARLTHRLVRYDDGAIAGPYATHLGLGITTWELIFFPAVAVETWARTAIRRIAGPPPTPVSVVDGS